MKIKNTDEYVRGMRNERKVLAYLNKKYGNFRHTKRYDLFDFSGTSFKDVEYTIELKSRNVPFNQYPTTMVGHNKVKICENDITKKKYRFLFLFTDGLYCWKYNRDQYKIDNGGRCDRGKNEIKRYCFIDTKYLKLISTEILNSG